MSRRGMTIAYEVHGGLYLNLTNRCPCACTFCLRQTMDHVGEGNNSLWLAHEPSMDEIRAALEERELSGYKELVFCGFGEPTERLDALLETARYVRARCPQLPIRINTNGLGDLVNGRPIAPLLSGLIDTVSISLNTPDAAEYLRLTRSKFGMQSFGAMLKFAEDCVRSVPNVVLTTVDTTISHEEEAECRAICARIGAACRIRPWED